MSVPESALLEILRIGHATSMRGEGISLRTALSRANYVALRTSLDTTLLIEQIQKNASLMEEWYAYSADKRTTGGWYLKPLEIGRVNDPASVIHFATGHEAVAEYIRRELDFWARM